MSLSSVFAPRNRATSARRILASAVCASVENLESRTMMSNTWYVATSGSNGAAGTLANPFASIQYAVDRASSGDTIQIRGGTYTSAVTIRKANLTLESYAGETAKIAVGYGSGSPDVAVRIDLDAHHTTLRNLDISGGYYYALKTDSSFDSGDSNPHGPTHLLIDGSKLHDSGRDVIKLTPMTDYSIIQNSEIYNSGRRDPSNAEGIDAVQANHAIVRNNRIHDTTTNGLYYKGGSVGTLIEGNKVYNVAHSGIVLGQSSDENWFDVSVNPNYYESIDSVVRNNIVWNVQGAGIGAWAALRPQVYNNTLVDVAKTMFGGLLVQGQEHWPSAGPLAGQYVIVPSTDVTMYNNIVVATGSRPALTVRTDGLTGYLRLNNNLYSQPGKSVQIWDDVHGYSGGLAGWQALGYDQGSIEADPNLDSSGNNYKLTAGSPAIDQGKISPLTRDFGGNTRPVNGKVDIGAWEFGQATSPDQPGTPVSSTWDNTAIRGYRRNFKFEFDATVTDASSNVRIGLSSGEAYRLGHLGIGIRFNTAGTIDALNGGRWTALRPVSYAEGQTYHFTVLVNTQTNTYRVSVNDGTRGWRIANKFKFTAPLPATGTFSNVALKGNATLSNLDLVRYRELI